MGGSRPAGQWNGWFAAGKAHTKTPCRRDAVANRWLARAHPGERASAVRAFPGYFTLDTTYGGKEAAMISVNAATGAVWYHGWHGGFLAGREYP